MAPFARSAPVSGCGNRVDGPGVPYRKPSHGRSHTAARTSLPVRPPLAACRPAGLPGNQAVRADEGRWRPERRATRRDAVDLPWLPRARWPGFPGITVPLLIRFEAERSPFQRVRRATRRLHSMPHPHTWRRAATSHRKPASPGNSSNNIKKGRADALPFFEHACRCRGKPDLQPLTSRSGGPPCRCPGSPC